MTDKRLVRVREGRMVLGVAAGIANYVNVDPVLVRLLFVLLALASGWGVLIYIILAIVMPEADEPSAKANFFDEEEEIVIK